MRTIRFFSEYLAPPFFDSSVENMGHLEIEELPISKDLKFEISKWNEDFQSTFNHEYPPDSGFKTIEELQNFNKKGNDLAEKIQKELGEEFKIIYEPN